MHEPLTNDEIIARLDVLMRRLDEVKKLIKEVQEDSKQA